MSEVSEGAAPAPVGSVLADVIAFAWRHRRLTAAVALASAILGGLVAVLIPATYDSRAAFVPESRQGPTLGEGLASLASRYGVNVGGASGRGSADFFVALLRSRTILEAIAMTPYTAPGRQDSVLVRDLVVAPAADKGITLERAVQSLQGSTRVELDRLSGVITITVRARQPAFAAWLAGRYLTALDAFNRDQRKGQARLAREFLAVRVEEAERELRAAEARVESFSGTNREYRGSAGLELEFGRLQRRVAFAQEKYTSMAREYENARLSEINETPVVSVIEEPQVPKIKAAPARRQIVLLALAVGLSLSTALGLMADWLARGGSATPWRDGIAAARRKLLSF